MILLTGYVQVAKKLNRARHKKLNEGGFLSAFIYLFLIILV